MFASRADVVIRPSRRDFVRIAGLTAFSLGGRAPVEVRAASPTPVKDARAKACILIWLDGGPSHLDTLDPKPLAPAEVRGPFAPISTAVSGVAISELMPRVAERMDQVAVIRSITSPLGEHNFGAHYLLTGYKPTPAIEYPTFGSVVSHLKGGQRVLPDFIAAPMFRVGGGRFSGHGYLPSSAAPFSAGGDPGKPGFQVRDLDFYPGLDGDRLQRRRDYLDRLDTLSRTLEASPEAKADAAFEQAFRLVMSADAKRAFQLDDEPPRVRQTYGGKTIGQCCLLARRLVERGVPFVMVNNPGWDTHDNAYTRLKEGYTGAQIPVGLVPSLDQALAALLDDLRQSGLLDQTLVLVMGEFGRTPKLNTAGGRDHWPRVFSVLAAGAGIPGGQVIGSSDSVAENPYDRPVTPSDLAATVYTLLGIEPSRTLTTNDGRPIRISNDGRVIRELMG